MFVIDDYKRSCEVADIVLSYNPFCEGQRHPIYKRKEFVSAIIKLSRLKEFDNKLVLKKINLNPRAFVPCISSDEYIRMIEDIVNYKNKNRIRFNV